MSMTLNDPRQPKTWQDANDLLGDKERMKIGNNTWLERDGYGYDITVRLHQTTIIRYHAPYAGMADYVTLNSGGYQTVTTKQRMNLLTNLRITQSNWEWFVTEPRRDHSNDLVVWFPSNEQNPTMEFEDGDSYRNVAV